MARPRAEHGPPRFWNGIRYLIIDGYVDEPAVFGVPPYISPQARSMAGGFVEGGASIDEIGYATIDQLRAGGFEMITRIGSLEIIVILAGCNVPGKYIRGDPISRREILTFSSYEVPVVVTGPAAGGFGDLDVEISQGDPGVVCYGLASTGNVVDRDRNQKEWNRNLVQGTFIVKRHPDHPSPLICEIETMRGCPRFVSGGCSFCSEPGKGPLQMRETQYVIEEIAGLASFGVENIRIGGQSDLLSYGSSDIGKCDTVEPDPKMIAELMSGSKTALHTGKGVMRAVENGRRIGIDTGIIHTDNANPEVISQYPDASRQALMEIIDGSTPGSVLALGLESSDPSVREKNNLNSGPDDVIKAVELINDLGRKPGINGMPALLPGLNFLGGLPGQKSFDMDIELLEEIMRRDLLLRRINIRGALFPGDNGRLGAPYLKGDLEKSFRKFKEKVRNEFDPVFLKRMLPEGSVIRGVFVEASSGGTFFGRQIGSYPILVGIGHSLNIGEHIDVCVTEHSSRSITGFKTPFEINKASFRDLQGLPGVGKKRAATLFRKMPLKREDMEAMEGIPTWLMDNIIF